VPVPSAALLARLAPLTPVPGRPDLVAHHAPDVFALWEAWEAECGAPQAVPFWATVWPAAQLLARVLQAESAWVRGHTVLDLGCGGGAAPHPRCLRPLQGRGPSRAAFSAQSA
jgi:predicted nicotinamide N-methyase